MTQITRMDFAARIAALLIRVICVIRGSSLRGIRGTNPALRRLARGRRMINIPGMIRFFLPLVLALADLAAQSPAPFPPATPEPALEWHDVTQWGVEGRAWPDLERERWFDRLPVSAQGKVTPKVWDLSRDSAGMMVRFNTDATTIWAHYILRSEHLASPNMTAIGGSGIDLYARDESGKWRWVGVAKPDKKEVKQALIGGVAHRLRPVNAAAPA